MPKYFFIDNPANGDASLNQCLLILLMILFLWFVCNKMLDKQPIEIGVISGETYENFSQILDKKKE